MTLLWQLFSFILNIILKFTFKQKRPNNSINANIIYDDKYGMPSGHAQVVMSQLIVIAFYFKNKYLTSLALIQTLITLWQRYYTNQHTMNQLLIGSFIGIVVGLLFLLV
jgi:membrane-associated phospholipid phosphatase